MGKQRLSAEITIGSVLENSFKKNVGLIRSGFDKVGGSITSVKARQRELTRDRNLLKKQGKSVEALDREYEDLERTLEDLVRKQRRWERAMRDSARVGETFGRMTSNIGRMGRRMAVGLTAAGAGIFALTSSTAAYGDNVAKTAGKLGIGIEALQEYRYAAERSGVSTESFDSSLTAMQKRLGEAAQGTGAAKKALDQIGLSAQDLVNMGPADAMAAIADKMQLIEHPAERAAIAAALFSRSGIGMVNMLGNGSEALQQLREDARKTGYVLSEDAARGAEAFADAQLDAQLVIKGLKNTIGAELMPVVTRSMKTFSAWAITNRDDIADFARTASEKLEAALPVIGQVAEGMGRVASTIGTVATKVAEMVGGWDNFGIVIGTVFAARTIGSIASFGIAVGRLGLSLVNLAGITPLVVTGIRAIGSALLVNPIGLAVAAIAGSAYLIYQNWEKIGPWFGDLWDGVRTTFQGIGGFISGAWRGDMDAAAAGLSTAWDGAKSYLSTVLDGIGAVFSFAWTNGIKPITDKLGMTDEIEAAWQGLGGWFGTYWEGVKTTFQGIGSFISGAWLGDMDAAADGLSKAWEGAKGSLATIFGGIGNVYKSAWNDAIKPVVDRLGITDAITSAWQTVKTELQQVLDWLGQKFDWLMGKLQPVLDGLTWLRDKGVAALDSIGYFGSGETGQGEIPAEDSLRPSGLSQQRQNDVLRQQRERLRALGVPEDRLPKISGSFLGGDIGRGFRRVGEQGPETIWNSKGGYVAHASATERLSRLSARAEPLMSKLGGGLRRAMDQAKAVAAPVMQQVQQGAQTMTPAMMPALAPAAQPAPVNIYAQINAQNMSVSDLADELERRGRAAQAGALYDGAHDYGQYGGG